MINGLLSLSWWQYIVITLVLTQITAISITLYLHRCQAHRGLELHPVVSHVFRFWLWLTTGMITKEWVAVHRKHHAKCETEDDPHSPQIVGLKKVFFGGYGLYRKEADKQATLDEYGHKTPDDWIERNVYSRFNALGIFLLLGINFLLFGVVGILMWIVQMIWIPLWAAGVINGVGHYWGYRNFECPDASTNISPVGIIMGGEELHNNHHTYPTSAKFSVKPWEFDFGWMFISIFRAFGLAKVKRLPPKLSERDKPAIDVDTLKAVLVNRFQILSHYTRDVLLPVFKEEKAKEFGKALSRKTKALLISDQSLLDGAGRKRLGAALKEAEALQVVYQFRLQLQAIWAQAKADQKEHLAALKTWCEEAESTGIKALQDFARRVKSFSPTRDAQAVAVDAQRRS